MDANFAAHNPQITSDCHYFLRCLLCGLTFEDDGLQLACTKCGQQALLEAAYRQGRMEVDIRSSGIFRYRNWLPIKRSLPMQGTSVTIKSPRLSAITGLSNLWLSFNGYWPQQGARLPTCSFKDLEAQSVLGRIPAGYDKILVIASAGNTASAFAHACSQLCIRLIIIVPDYAVNKLIFTHHLNPCVKLVSLFPGGDYNDAISLAQFVCQSPAFFPEGGVRNVARRDGLGTVLLHFAEKVGRLPDYYFQAVGSGAGALGVNSMANRLSVKGIPPHLHLSQNLPLAPVYSAWTGGFSSLIANANNDVQFDSQNLYAQVLANRQPPYAIAGGLFDTLSNTDGRVSAITNDEGFQASCLFEELEAVDIDPAAGIALASLLKASRDNTLPRDAHILLNISGGGRRLWASHSEIFKLLPSRALASSDEITAALPDQLLKLFA